MAKRKLYDGNGNEVQEKSKKPLYKRVSFWVAILIVGYIFSVFGRAEVPKEEVQADVESKETTEVVETKVEENKKTETLRVGDSVSVGTMEYIVNGIETADTVGPEFLNAEANGVFLIVDLTVKNNGNEAVFVDSSFFKLVDGEKTFDADSVSSAYANEGKTTFFLASLNPDVELSGRIVFDVSESQANSETVQLKVSTGVFGTETEVIDLH